MELEEMKKLWESMSQKVEKQKLVTDKIIMEMTQIKYKSKFNKILMYERFGAIICLVFGVVVLFNFGKLDTWYLMLLGILTLLMMVLFPILSLRSLSNLSKMELHTASYRDTLVRFERAKRRVLLMQRGALIVTIPLMLITIPVFSKIMGNKDFFQMDHPIGLWIFIGLTSLGMLWFARWGYGCYLRMTQSAENVLKDLES